jgi:MFS superfamily sulfate permease-like transporter
LPSLTFEPIPFDAYLGMILPAIGVLLVAYSEAVAVAREFATKHGYEIDADQELTAHGASNLVSALLGGMLAAGSMSASAVKEGAGARSQVTNLITWVATLVTLLFLTPLFAPLPEAVLGALIIHALWRILVARKLKRLREASPTEFWFGLFAMLGVVLIDVLQGMVIGLVSSLLFVVYRSSRPHLARLGRVPGVAAAYTDLERHPENRPVPGVLIARLDAPLYYANALTVRDGIKTLLAETDPAPSSVVLDLSVQSELDLTSAEMLDGLIRELRTRGLEVGFANVRSVVVDAMRTHGVFEQLDDSHVYWDVDQAVRALGPGG